MLSKALAWVSRHPGRAWLAVLVLVGFSLGMIVSGLVGEPTPRGTDVWVAGSSLLVALGTGALAWQTYRLGQAARIEGEATTRLARGAELERELTHGSRPKLTDEGQAWITARSAGRGWNDPSMQGNVRGSAVDVVNLGRGIAEHVSAWFNLAEDAASAGATLPIVKFSVNYLPPHPTPSPPLGYDARCQALRSTDIPFIFGENAVDRPLGLIFWADSLGFLNRMEFSGGGYERWRTGSDAAEPPWTVVFIL